MGKIIYRNGDLFCAAEQHIVHGCNNRGGFGSGVAGQVRRRYPLAFQAYDEHYRNNALVMGSVHHVEDCGRIIFNAVTQNGFGSDGRKYVDYDAIEMVFETINALSLGTSDLTSFDTIVMPTIGAGLGGGDWDIIAKIIENQCNHVIPVVYLFDGKLPRVICPL